MAGKRGPGERATLSAIKDAYLAGDYELCLGMCEAFAQKDVRDAAEIVLLRARCLIQLDRGDQALEVLQSLRLRDDQHDEYLTGRMLMSAAFVGLGKYDEGLKIARDAYDQVDGAHPTVRAELILNLAIAHYRKGEYAAATRYLNLIPETEDIVYARSLQFRGNVARAHGDFGGAFEKYHEAFAHLDRCRNRDRFTEAFLLYSLATLCAEMPRLDLWPEIAKRIEEFDWSVSGVTTWRYYIALACSLITELLGELEASTEWASLAEEIAPDPVSVINAWIRLAASLGRYGEKRAHAYLTNRAVRKYDSLPRGSRLCEQATLPLVIAEEVLYTDSFLRASRLVSYYADFVAPVRSVGVQARKVESSFASVKGLLEERRGNKARAEESYRHALEISRSTGLKRTAAIVAYRLFALTGEEQYERFILDALQGVSEKYWVKARLVQNQLEARLTERQIEIVRLVAEGLTNKEIAHARGISISRVKNAIGEIFTILGIRSRAELATLATRRGLVHTD